MKPIYAKVRNTDGTASEETVDAFTSVTEASISLGVSEALILKYINQPTSIHDVILYNSASDYKYYKSTGRKRFALYDSVGNIITSPNRNKVMGFNISEMTNLLKGYKTLGGVEVNYEMLRRKVANVFLLSTVVLPGIFIKRVKPYGFDATIDVSYGYQRCNKHRNHDRLGTLTQDKNIPNSEFTVNSHGSLASECIKCRSASFISKAAFISKMQAVFKAEHGVHVNSEMFSDVMYIKYYNSLGCSESAPIYEPITRTVHAQNVVVEYNGVVGEFSNLHSARLHFAASGFDGTPLETHNDFIRACSSVDYVQDYSDNLIDNYDLVKDPNIWNFLVPYSFNR